MKNSKYVLIAVVMTLVLAAIACDSSDISAMKYEYLTKPAYIATEKVVEPTMMAILRDGLTATASAALTQNGPKPVTDTRPCTGNGAGALLTVGTYEKHNVKFWLEGTKLKTNVPAFGPFELDGNWKQVGTIDNLCFRINQGYLQILVKPEATSTPSLTAKRP